MSHRIENAREKLLTHGREVLLSAGYDSLNIKALARDCGMASGTFYQYFHNKDELVMQVIYERCEIIPESIRKISLNNWKLSRKLKYVYEQFRQFQKSYTGMKIGVLRLSGDYEELRARVMTEINAAVEDLLNNEIKRGRLELHADTATAAYLLTHLLFSVGRDADLDFDVIWDCMNFRDLGNGKQPDPPRQEARRENRK
ncbi:MAG: TetR/AcrR family transcriptional regulator [Lachnospiraceae bacterium]|jgi:AcrR family transcriptional regulator|nr:TetR/AcrR family transcriptional regulator [Lachnospiraceae bacterium]